MMKTYKGLQIGLQYMDTTTDPEEPFTILSFPPKVTRPVSKNGRELGSIYFVYGRTRFGREVRIEATQVGDRYLDFSGDGNVRL